MDHVELEVHRHIDGHVGSFAIFGGGDDLGVLAGFDCFLDFLRQEDAVIVKSLRRAFHQFVGLPIAVDFLVSGALGFDELVGDHAR